MLNTNRQTEHNFALVPDVGRPRSAFNRSHKKILTMDFDYLYPIYCRQTLPGDTFSITLRYFARLLTSKVPLMDNTFITTQAFHTPNRLLQKTWQRLISNEREYPTQDNSTLTTHALDLSTTPSTGIPNGHLLDYFGWPTLVDLRSSNLHYNIYHALAYNLIWNTLYRDQNLQDPVYFDDDLAGGQYDYTDFNLLKRGKRHDLYTGALLSTQQGTQSLVNILGIAPVLTNSENISVVGNTDATQRNLTAQAATNDVFVSGAALAGAQTLRFGNESGLYTALSAGSAYFLINEFRTSYSVQLLLESDARGGTRYVESIYHRWGVNVPDYRLQIPEYIAYNESPFNTNVVPQTSETGTSAQGNLAAFSTNSDQLSFTHSCVEHGWLIILASARGNITYQQGIPKEYTYMSRYDFYTPELAHIGEVPILRNELYMTGVDINDGAIFGYNEYGYELRYTPSSVHGKMRSNDPASLDAWHLADDYSSPPMLDDTWIESNTPIERNLINTTEPHIKMDIFVEETYTTSLPVYSIPGLGRTL